MGLILLVDDNKIQAFTRERVLSSAGFEVIVKSSGEEALEVLKLGQEIDLVITDHDMVGMTGFDLCNSIRKLFPLLPILVITGAIESQTLFESLNIKFRLKPLPPQELISIVTSMLL